MSIDLHHHGDRDTAPGLVDLAVNVRLPSPPAWLAEVVTRTVADLGRYPDARPATQAIARRHRVPEEAVLPTSGGAEAFTLVARAVAGVEPWVVHPQFTEPEAALTAAGRPVRRHVLVAGGDFRLDPAAFDRGGPAEGCDLVVVGNPTNPTGVLHRRADLLALRRAGRVLVVDEAFMDAVPGETESLIGDDLEGLLVLRSLTKTWGLAGLRAGYVVGDPALISALRAVQPPWSVSSPALAATVACLSDRGVAEADAAALEIATLRSVLVDGLTAAGVAPVPSRAPFVLVETSSLGPGSVREPLAAEGFAVRRAETFPGLGPTWIRMAVRDADTSQQLCAALRRLGGRRVA
ncbi:histidinol-phosphate/aromatic aminotransferase/cobyric acid decarboxylase-like protein [Humibacillus xanthopallidus]|uniref:Aminotransferase n=1 Tax=Humibacillus xanthopallidus TaxID=412689 RepID=A0A543PL65_9MICO|nr:Rv2231c family pyridoxal phosphate-dependent protein CobC [Humibacillus xanthopallidus]TQN44810.1 histidinol-phosphate/aromatic aminotransferase/cobyric acid decarboxylase-like protein [Humibacillus xanthopallidus]